MKCSECGRRLRTLGADHRGGRPRSTCSKACARARDIRIKRLRRFGEKVSAVNNPAEEGWRREFRHWSLTGEAQWKGVWSKLSQERRDEIWRERAEVWSKHTCPACKWRR